MTLPVQIYQHCLPIPTKNFSEPVKGTTLYKCTFTSTFCTWCLCTIYPNRTMDPQYSNWWRIQSSDLVHLKCLKSKQPAKQLVTSTTSLTNPLFGFPTISILPLFSWTVYGVYIRYLNLSPHEPTKCLFWLRKAVSALRAQPVPMLSPQKASVLSQTYGTGAFWCLCAAPQRWRHTHNSGWGRRSNPFFETQPCMNKMWNGIASLGHPQKTITSAM